MLWEAVVCPANKGLDHGVTFHTRHGVAFGRGAGWIIRGERVEKEVDNRKEVGRYMIGKGYKGKIVWCRKER